MVQSLIRFELFGIPYLIEVMPGSPLQIYVYDARYSITQQQHDHDFAVATYFHENFIRTLRFPKTFPDEALERVFSMIFDMLDERKKQYDEIRLVRAQLKKLSKP